MYLGIGTGIMGRKSAINCAIAVEELIAKQYNDQIKKLIEEDRAGHSELLEVRRPYYFVIKLSSWFIRVVNKKHLGLSSMCYARKLESTFNGPKLSDC